MKTVDIREIAPKERHSLIFREFNMLEPGESLVLRTDHDPKPLYYQFEAEQKGRFDWKKVLSGPDVWEVSVTRVDKTPTVADVAREYPSSMELFNRLGIDYCCHGDRPFYEVAREAGHSPENLLAQIREVPPPVERLNFDHWSLTMLSDFIVMNHHRYVHEKLPEIKELAGKVVQAHGTQHPFLPDLKEKIEVLADELLMHLDKEEEQLFPAIRQAEEKENWEAESIRSLQDNLREEHEVAGSLIREIRRLTDDYNVPADACFSFHRLYDLLADFERDLYVHVHLENNILFNKLEGKTRASV